MHVKKLIEFIETIAPLYASCPWDSSGVQIHSAKKDIRTLVVALDPTPDTVAKAITLDADFILVHHPLLLKPQFLNTPSSIFDVTQMLLGSSTWLYAAHTSLDANPQGPAGFLARELNADSIQIVSPTYSEKKFLFTILSSSQITLPLLDREAVSVLSASETLVLCTVEPSYFSSIIHILQENDLYYSYTPLQSELKNSMGIGFIIKNALGVQKKELLSLLSRISKKDIFSVSGTLPNTFFRIGYCTGAGSSLIPLLDPNLVDVFITGEIKHHHVIDTVIPLIDIGHYALEEYMMREMALVLEKVYPDLHVIFIDSVDPFRFIHKDD